MRSQRSDFTTDNREDSFTQLIMLKILDLLFYSKYFWIAAVLAVIYAYLKFFVYAYWKRHGVPHETPTIPFGNMFLTAIGKTYFGYFIRESYKKFRHHRYYGIYVLHRAVLVVNDSEIIDQILIKQFDKFNGRGMYHDAEVDPLTFNLFSLSGDRWKSLRMKLTTAFTPKKLKEIFPLIKEISNELVKACDSAIVKNDVVEMKDLMSRYTTDIITSIVYGHSCKSLSDPDNEFKRYGNMAFDVSPMKTLLGSFYPKVLSILRISYFRKAMTRFFSKAFQDAVKYRRQSNTARKDFLSLLIQQMDNGMVENKDNDNDDVVNVTHKLSMIEAQAQAFIFFLGGFETSSSNMTYFLYEMALNCEIQGKAHEEVDKFLMEGELTYERIQSELRYIDMAISETIRKYPTFLATNRLCNADWRIPDSDYTIKKGTYVIMPTLGLSYDPDIYPDPEKFDPNRFLNDSNGSTHTSSVYLPFGSGPKYCIGTRLAMLQLKLGLVALLSNYKFSKCEKTPVTMQYSKRSFALSPGCGVYLRLEKRTKKYN